MFSYYGSKSKIVHLYPKPKHGLIIEPFAGSARYALRYFDRDVILVDKYDVIIRVWKYLQQASEKDILGLPKLKRGDEISGLPISVEEKSLLGFIYKGGDARPANTVSYFGEYEHGNQQVIPTLAKQLFKIRHWQLVHGTYECLSNPVACWFIDPPYFKGGEHYAENAAKINFNALSKWCGERNGQVIVCENSKASWMPFVKLKKIQGSANSNTTEVFWTNEKVEFQAALF